MNIVASRTGIRGAELGRYSSGWITQAGREAEGGSALSGAARVLQGLGFTQVLGNQLFFSLIAARDCVLSPTETVCTLDADRMS
ncbi:hypothetical protein [Stenotrophomonas maltophilia]|uniref:hypothetical protein n=1 Tax=Stenotrophomonas maltophilia TaxID=40324 RepID=UPI003D7DE410